MDESERPVNETFHVIEVSEHAKSAASPKPKYVCDRNMDFGILSKEELQEMKEVHKIKDVQQDQKVWIESENLIPFDEEENYQSPI